MRGVQTSHGSGAYRLLWSGPVSDANSPAVQAARKAEGRAANHQSWAHRLDNWMRRELSSAVRSWRDEGGGGRSRDLDEGEAATAARKEILANLRLQVDEARRQGAGEEGEGRRSRLPWRKPRGSSEPSSIWGEKGLVFRCSNSF